MKSRKIQKKEQKINDGNNLLMPDSPWLHEQAWDMPNTVIYLILDCFYIFAYLKIVFSYQRFSVV